MVGPVPSNGTGDGGYHRTKVRLNLKIDCDAAVPRGTTLGPNRVRQLWHHSRSLCILGVLLTFCRGSSATPSESLQARKQLARTQFETAEQMREALNGRPTGERTRHDYQKVADAYRKVYYVSPGSSKADASVVAVAEILAEMGRQFSPGDKDLHAAIGQYEFLRREYPGSKYRVEVLFTIGQIYKEDLGDEAGARETFEEFLKRYPHNQLASKAREAIAELNQPKTRKKEEEEVARANAGPSTMVDEQLPAPKKTALSKLTGIRHWSTADYTRVAIDLDAEVKYQAGRVPDPDRIFFDLPDTRLVSTLVGKSFDVQDGFLKKIRVAQYQPGSTRVVLEVDDVAEYSAFLLPNPFRLIIDIHGRTPHAQSPVAANPAAAVERGEYAAKNPPPMESASQRAKAAVPAQKAGDKTASITSNPTPGEVSKPEPTTSGAQTSRVSTAGTQRAANSHPTEVSPKTDGKLAISEIATAAPSPDLKSGTAKPAHSGPEKSVSPASPSETPAVMNGKSEQTAVARDSRKSVATTARVVQPKDDSDADLVSPGGVGVKATTKPTAAPTAVTVPPDKKTLSNKKSAKATTDAPRIHEASPTADGDRSLIRALGLKIGRIVIDAGHGGHDTGTIGPNGLLEKDLVLEVALRLGRLLESRLGADVIYTRDDDTFIPLETRTAIANEKQADLFISIHANSSEDSSARGVETYYLNFTSNPEALEVAARENAVSEKSIHELQDLVKKITLKEKIDESRELASDVQQSLYAGLSAKSPTLRNRGVKKAPFVVLIGANMPSILAEISFVSNPADEKKLETPEYRQKIAESFYKGIAKYVGGLSGVRVASKFNKDAGQ